MNQELIHKYLKGETSSLENQEILDWVETSRENRKEFLRYRRLYDTAIWNETGQLSDNIKKKTVQAVPFIRRWMQVAAIIAIVISGTVFIQQRIFNA
ncbi:MAG: FecR family protein, partial [Paludibacter sp.]|nr:FecR family protein [Paludibacter sp.]